MVAIEEIVVMLQISFRIFRDWCSIASAGAATFLIYLSLSSMPEVQAGDARWVLPSMLAFIGFGFCLIGRDKRDAFPWILAFIAASVFYSWDDGLLAASAALALFYLIFAACMVKVGAEGASGRFLYLFALPVSIAMMSGAALCLTVRDAPFAEPNAIIMFVVGALLSFVMVCSGHVFMERSNPV